MDIRTDEIAPDLLRFSAFVTDIAPPAGFTFNAFLLRGEEPLLFHCGARWLFPGLSAALARVLPLERLRWISFGHVEADECGAMNLWLAAAPRAEVVHGQTACMVSLNDLADRPPRALADGEVLDIGGRRLRWLDTPHVPHGWEAGVLFEESAGTLLCGDLFTHVGQGPALTEEDLLGPAAAAEEAFQATALAPATGQTLRRLAALRPRTLALMHGASFAGDGAAQLTGLAGFYEQRIAAQRAA